MRPYSTAFDTDWAFYLANRNKFSFAGVDVAWPSAADGVDAKRAFFHFDSSGVSIPTSEPELLLSVIRCKKAVNLQIKAWSEGYEDCLIGFAGYLGEFSPPVPAWVEGSLRKQSLKAYRKRVAAGFTLWQPLYMQETA